MTRAAVESLVPAVGRRPAPAGYFARSELPLTSLLFVLPLVTFYELGTRYWLTDARGGTEHIIAFSLMRQFFALLGATGQHLPAVAVIGLLLAMHIARNDAWALYPKTCAAMGLESIAVAVPLVLFGRAIYPYLRQIHLLAHGQAVSPGMFVLPVGAGVYEELLFRLIALTLLSTIFKDVLRWPAAAAATATVVVSAVLFSLYHYLGAEPFAWPTAAFRALAGVYFGIVFLTRGFGVTAGAHAAYDILVAFV